MESHTHAPSVGHAMELNGMNKLRRNARNKFKGRDLFWNS